MSECSSATSALRLTFSVFTSTSSAFISPNAVFVSLIVLPTSIISPFSFPTNSFSRHCTSLQNSKSASVFTTCVLISNSCPLLPQVPTTKTPSAYSVLHCPRWIPPNPAGGGFTVPQVAFLPLPLAPFLRNTTHTREEVGKVSKLHLYPAVSSLSSSSSSSSPCLHSSSSSSSSSSCSFSSSSTERLKGGPKQNARFLRFEKKAGMRVLARLIELINRAESRNSKIPI